ncbi:uncharacterized protein LOC135949115 [Calliphora vicina]|uniref:uncharacterized protein LOC135949115 n=1 Tax=Calliphora vicina TaxID=7373 RepID=UPI00325AAD5F
MGKNLIFGLLLLGICWNVEGLTGGLSATANLADVILKSTYSMENNPALTANCFQIYMPQINDLAQKYEQAYNGCTNQTAESEETLKQQVQDDIDTIQNVTKSMCSNFENCALVTETLYATFECYYNVSGNNMQSAFEVQNLSKEKMKFVKINEEYIMYNQTLCTDECSRVYIEESSKVHANLEACLAGKPPSDEVTTTTDKPDVTTKETPLLTTVAPDAKVPETTKAPEVTTEKIETTPIDTTTKVSESS